MKNQKRFGKLLITLLSTGVLLAALQSQEIITAEETTTAEQVSTTSAEATTTGEAVTTTETPARAAKEANAKVKGTIKNHGIKNYEYYTDVDIAVTLTDDDVKEGDYVTITLENVAVLGSLACKDVIYEGKKIGTISIEFLRKH